MADKPFRVLLDLTDLHIDSFKYVWINVSPRELKTISDFKTALLHKINLKQENIKLFVRDGLLLDQETIIVLREDDTVKVQFAEHSQSLPIDCSSKERKKFSRKRNCSECDVIDVPVKKSRGKIDSEDSTKSNESNFLEIGKEKKKKHKKSHNSVSMDKMVHHSEILETNHNELESQKKNDKKKSGLLENITECGLTLNSNSFFSFDSAEITAEQFENNESSVNVKSGNVTSDSTKNSSSNVNQQQVNEMGISESFLAETVVKKAESVNNCPKKKRKRHKKRRQTTPTIANFSPDVDAKFMSFSDNADENVKRKHIIYSELSCEKTTSVICDNANEVHSSSKDTYVVNENISNGNVESFKSYPKISTPSQSNGCGNPNWHISLMQSKNSDCNIRNNETPSHKKEYRKEITQDKALVKKDASLQNSEENNLSPEIQYDNLPDLNSMPEVGTHIVYKTLELDESYSPVVSEYREGIVKDINPDTEEMEIELVKHLIKPGRTGKFENLKTDEIPYPEIKRNDSLRWSDIVSPKLFS